MKAGRGSGQGQRLTGWPLRPGVFRTPVAFGDYTVHFFILNQVTQAGTSIPAAKDEVCCHFPVLTHVYLRV